MEQNYKSLIKQMANHRRGESRLREVVQIFIGMVLCTILLAGLPARQAAASVQAQKKSAGSPSALIQAVNAVRSANGLAPFQVNSALMAAAQAHSEYQASIDSTSHTGRGGSDIKGRAMAAGYGGGANVSVIENVYGGMGATPGQAVSWWQGDGIHLETLLSTRHTEVGAGAAVSDSGVVYYTLDVGAVAGGSSSGNSPAGSASTPASSGSGAASAPAATEVTFSAIQISTPNPDGAVIHVVQPGQTLWAIAATYKINILDLLNQNGLNANAFIVPGQKIVIQPAGSLPTEIATPEETIEKPTRTPRPSATPTVPATEVAELQPTQQAVNTEKIQVSDRQAPGPRVDPLLLGIIGLMVGGAVLVLAGIVVKRAG
jgi:uncharacterized protein YkwD/LysM repeat protein